MSHAQKIVVTVVMTVAVTIIAALIALQSMRGGHGSYIPAALLFPFALLPAFAIDHADWLLITLALLQFPIYGTVLGRAWLRGRLPRASLVVTIAHSVVALGCVAAIIL